MQAHESPNSYVRLLTPASNPGQGHRLPEAGADCPGSKLEADSSRPDYPTSIRLPRFSRSKSPPPIQLTHRDLDILRSVARFRYLTREQIQLLFFAPSGTSQCKRRLTLLYHNGYLERLLVPIPMAYGASRAAYCLDRRGALLLNEVDDIEVEWRHRDLDRETYFLEHTLASNDALILFVLAAARAGLEITWQADRDLRRLEPAKKAPVIPDAYIKVADASGKRLGFAVELDRATEDKSAFLRKVRAYGEWVSAGGHEGLFGLADLRILFLVAPQQRDPRRLARMKAWAESAGGRSLFWFADLRSLRSENILQGAVWAVGGRSDLNSIMEPSCV